MVKTREEQPASKTFVESFDSLSRHVYHMAKSKGWWDEPREDGVLIALMHSELSEALEGLRQGNPASEHISEFTALEEELGDVIIRIMDMAAHKKLRLGDAIIRKIAFNATREHKHGGKRF